MKPVPETVYTPDAPLRNPIQLLKKIISDNWSRRELCAQLFWRNIKAQYRQTFLGLVWVFLPAIVSAAVWVFLYSSGVVQFENSLAQGQYVAYVLVGMILWQSFVEAYSSPINAYQQNRAMMSKINFPREVIVLVSVCEVFFNASIRCVLMVPIIIWLAPGASLSLATFLFPVFFAGLILTGITVGLFLVPIGGIYMDVGRVLTMITPIWMVLTPVIYPTPTTWPANLLVYCNVVSPTLVTARDCLLGQSTGYAMLGWVYLVAVLPVFVLGLILYRISIPILIERTGN